MIWDRCKLKMKTIKPKAKSKKSNARFTREKFTTKESRDSPGPDLSQLRKPIDISVSSLLEVTKLLDIGSEEVKIILAYECDVVYECRICRSLFRSLANFISHKRVYCIEKFNVTRSGAICNDKILNKIPAETVIPHQESAEDDKSRETDNNIRILRSQVVRKASKKDLTSVVDMLQRKRFEDINENLSKPSSELEKSNSEVSSQASLGSEGDQTKQQVLLEAIDSTKTAVYQTVTEPTTVHTEDLMKAQIVELQHMAERSTVILNPDGRSMDVSQLEKSDSPLQLYGSDEEEGVSADTQCIQDLVCSVCNAKFATRKTLTYHMKSLHVSYRTCYPCPCCSSTFANTWSVYRHLFKVHRKTNEQVRKLRTQIQEKAFRKETTGAEDIEKENAIVKSSGTPEQQTSNNTQEWMEHFELDLELQRCGGCGRKFDRRAALISHSQFCQKRIAACNEAAGGNKSKRLSKTPSPSNVTEANTTDCMLNRAQTSKKQTPQKTDLQHLKSPVNTSAPLSDDTTPDVTPNSELSIRVENVSRISDADWEMIGSNGTQSPANGTLSPNSDMSTCKDHTSRSEKSLFRNVPDSPEIIFTSIDQARSVAISFGPKKRRVSLIDNSKESSDGSGETESSVHSSPSNAKEANCINAMTLMENRIATIANLRKMQCLPCRRKFTSMTNLRRHMAVHIGWHRYRCRLCDYKCFVKCDCVAHCNKVHDAQNNRAVIADMVIQIPPEQSLLAQEIMMDISKSYETNSQPELIDVSASSPKTIDASESTSDSNGPKSLGNKSTDEKSSTDKASDRVAEQQSVEVVTPREKQDSVKSSPEETRNQAQGRLDKDPDLRKMVMEVIFGTAQGGAAARSDSAELRDTIPKGNTPETQESSVKRIKPQESRVKLNEASESSVKRKKAKESRTVNQIFKTKTGANARSRVKDVRPQRPTRNRVRPVDQDFIYDLTELIRKESATHRAVATASQKISKKKQSTQQQAAAENVASAEIRSETDSNLQKLNSYKLPGLLSLRSGVSNGYNGKLSSLKQAEVKLNLLRELSSSKNGGQTKISVSGQK